MRNKRVWGLLLALTLAAGLLTGCGAAPETAEQDDRPALVVGVDPFPPMPISEPPARPSVLT